MSIKCSQCDREAIGAVNNGQGPAFCLEHMNMFQNMISRNLADLQRQEDSIMDYVEMTTGVRLRQPRPAPVLHHGNVTVNNIKIDRSNIGVVNTGNINDINSAITFIENSGHIEVASGLKNFSETIISSKELEDSQKNEILDHLAFLSNQIKSTPESRHNTTAKTTLNAIKEILSVSANLSTVWSVFYPLIKSYLGI